MLDRYGGTGDGSLCFIGVPFACVHFPCCGCVSLQRQNDEPPRMVLEPVRVQEGSAVLVTNASLSLRDLDTQSSQLVIVVSQSPEHGMS